MTVLKFLVIIVENFKSPRMQRVTIRASYVVELTNLFDFETREIVENFFTIFTNVSQIRQFTRFTSLTSRRAI